MTHLYAVGYACFQSCALDRDFAIWLLRRPWLDTQASAPTCPDCAAVLAAAREIP